MHKTVFILISILSISCLDSFETDNPSSAAKAQNKGSVLPVLETGIPMQVDSNKVEILGQIRELGKKDILEYGHSWSMTNTTNSLQNVSTFGTRSNTGTFHTLIEVEKGDVYYFQAYAISVVGTTFGEVQRIEIR